MNDLRLLALAVLGLAVASQLEAGAGDLTEAPPEWGLRFTHFNGMEGRLLFPEMTGQGAGLLDFDGDGDLDAYLVQGGRLGESGAGPSSTRSQGAVLMRNDTTDDGPRWVDVTERSQLSAAGYGMAVAVGDVNGDGWSDIFTGNYGANQLWRNRGDGTFEDHSAGLGETEERWTTGAAFVDIDGDGLDDLYVVNYVAYDVSAAPDCYAPSSRRDYCGPSGFAPQSDLLLRNRGDGDFEDISQRSGVANLAGSGLGIAVLDVDQDGTVELYVANDGQPNFLWRRSGDRWTDDALLAGVAVNRRGEPEASMGIAADDFDGDGDEDLFVAHLEGESNTLYVNVGGGLFDDRTSEYGLAAPSLPNTAFGVVWIDLDHDGWLELAVANGAVRIQERQAAAGDPYPLAQTNQLFRQRDGVFTEVVGSPFSVASEVSRGLIDGDLDNDGDRDLMVTNSAGPTRLFLNDGAAVANWLGVSLVHPAHQLVSARYVRSTAVARASTTGSYASAVDPRVILSGRERPRDVALSAAGRTLRLSSPPMGRYLRFDFQR